MKARFIFIVALFIFFISACKKKSTDLNTIPKNDFSKAYSIDENKIYNYANPVQLIGANALHVFSAGSSDMNSWKIDVVREFVGNVKECPLTGWVLKDANGAYLHPLQSVVDSNRANKKITIIGAFGWDGKTEFTGLSPKKNIWYNDFKNKLAQWAMHFKDQPDVWIEVWNEPYTWNRTDGYTDDIWMNDMNELVNIVRSTGNQNIIVVPCAEQGQDESVLINKGTEFLNGKTNILFDIHAYEKWMLVNNSNVENRLQQLQQKKLPIIFGEAAPQNSSGLMDPNYFLNTAYNKGISICAWLWKYDSTDTDALLNSSGLPNNNNNNNWGTTFKNICLQTRKP
jgi:mannan endo-1,4-beta-mannosidase